MLHTEIYIHECDSGGMNDSGQNWGENDTELNILLNVHQMICLIWTWGGIKQIEDRIKASDSDFTENPG